MRQAYSSVWSAPALLVHVLTIEIRLENGVARGARDIQASHSFKYRLTTLYTLNTDHFI